MQLFPFVGEICWKDREHYRVGCGTGCGSRLGQAFMDDNRTSCYSPGHTAHLLPVVLQPQEKKNKKLNLTNKKHLDGRNYTKLEHAMFGELHSISTIECSKYSFYPCNSPWKCTPSLSNTTFLEHWSNTL